MRWTGWMVGWALVGCGRPVVPAEDVVVQHDADAQPGTQEASSDVSDVGVTLGTTDIKGVLSRAVLVESMLPYRDDMRACVERKGTMTARVVITPEGTVASSATQASTIPPSDADCVNGVLMQLTFPEPSGGGVVIALQELSFDEP